MAMRVYLKTLGCRLNEAELESWKRGFHQQGVLAAEKPDDADILVVNTCAVTQEAVRKSRQLLRRAQRGNPRAKLVVSGCAATLQPERMASDLGVDLVVPNEQKDQLVSLTLNHLDFTAQSAGDMDNDGYRLLAAHRQRAFIKVQDGCRYRCSYCIVTLARGAERSRPIEDIVRQIRGLEAEGIQEVVLAGVHLGGYGSDLDSSLTALVESVLEQTHIPRLRLGSLEPWDLPSDFWRLFDNSRLMPHLHLPMQSGSDSVLRRMSRRCRSDEFLRLVEQAHHQAPQLNITSDIIVGFPGETDEEWQQTLDFVKAAEFGDLHIFAYSARSGTKAAYLPNQISRATKRQRSEQLHQLAQQLKRSAMEKQLGRTAEVLIENRVEDYLWAGYTENYMRVLVESADDLANSCVRLRLRAIENGQLIGE